MAVAAIMGVVICVTHCCAPTQGLQGSVITWSAGRWRLQKGFEVHSLVLLRAHCLPWLTFAQFRDTDGRIYRLWLPYLIGQRNQLRRFRVRLSLERGI